MSKIFRLFLIRFNGQVKDFKVIRFLDAGFRVLIILGLSVTSVFADTLYSGGTG